MDFGGQAIKMKDQSNLTVGLQQLLFSGQWILGMQTSKIAVRLTEQEVETTELDIIENIYNSCLLYTSPSPRDGTSIRKNARYPASELGEHEWNLQAYR